MIEVRYRTFYKGLPPQPIKLKIPGWAGVDHTHENGSKPQPWHCLPFVECALYGLELLYPYDNDCTVHNKDGKVWFEGDFSAEPQDLGIKWPPFELFAPGHYGFTSSLDIVGPPGHIIRIEPHPKYYTDETWTTPLPVAGHIQSEWWTRIFFIVFKTPPDGHCHVFKKYQPYAQILVLPKKVEYDINPMEQEEMLERNNIDNAIQRNDKVLGENYWEDHIGNNFNDKYKIIMRQFAKGGMEAVKEYIKDKEMDAQDEIKTKCAAIADRMKTILARTDSNATNGPHSI